MSVTYGAGMGRGAPSCPEMPRMLTTALTGSPGAGGGDTRVTEGGGTPHNAAAGSCHPRLLQESRSLKLFVSFSSSPAPGNAGAEWTGPAGGTSPGPSMQAETTTRVVLKPLSSSLRPPHPLGHPGRGWILNPHSLLPLRSTVAKL